MAFIVGWQASAGYFEGKVFSTAIEDYNQVGNWLTPPDPNGVLAVAGGNEVDMNWGEEVGLTWMHNSVRNLQQVLAIFPVQGTNTRREIVIKLTMNGDPGDGMRLANLGLYQRVYSDAEHYTDTQYGVDSTLDCNWPGTGNMSLTDRYSLSVGFATYGQDVYFVVGAHRKETNTRYGTLEYADRLIIMTYTNFLTWIDNGEVPEVDIDPDLGPAAEPGGYGPGGPSGGGGAGGPAPTFDGTSDPWVDDPIKPGIAALGLVNLYKCDTSSLVNLGAELFPDIHWPTSLSDVGEVLAAVSDSIWNSKLIDYIVSAHIIPVDVTGGNLTDIKVGTRTLTGILARPISMDVIEFDCGTLHIDEFYTNFVDYLTRMRIYVPFHGFVEIKPEYWQSADLQLKYIFNVIDGSFVAKLYSTVYRHQNPFKSLIGQYTGCACVHVPMTGQSYASMFGGMIANAGGMAAGFATGNVGQAATSALNSVAMAGGGPGMDMSNPYNASAGFYGHSTPYVIIERPVSHFPTNYGKEKGFPLLVTKTIGSCRGLTICESAVLNFACSDEEAAEIQAALKEGVIV